MSVAVQSPSKRYIAINGIKIEGLNKDDPWNVNQTGDQVTPEMDNTGEHVQYTENGDKSGTLALNLLATSKSAKYLSSLVGEVIEVEISDQNTGAELFIYSNEAMILNKPTISGSGAIKTFNVFIPNTKSLS